MRQRLLFALVVLLLLALGLLGQHQIAAERLTQHFTTSLYQVMMLFLLAGEWTLEFDTLPVAIEVVRFLAPLVAVSSLVLVLASTTRASLANYFVRFYSGHTVVVGLNQRSWQFLQTCERPGRFVVLERDPDNRLIAGAREARIKVITGSLSQPQMQARLNLAQADTLVAFTGNDGDNVETAVKVRNYLRGGERRQRPLRVLVHVNEFSLARQLEHYPKFFADYAITEIYFFSVYDLSARLLLRDYPPEVFADALGQERVHLAIHGFDHLGEKLLTEAALLCHYSNAQRLQITVYDPDAAAARHRLEADYPHLAAICDYQFIECDPADAQFFRGEEQARLASITQHVLCLDSDEENLGVALALRRVLLERRGCNAPILLRMRQASGLAQLLESNTGEPELPDGLYPFGMLEQVLHADNILASQLDQLARSIHERYLQEQRAQDPEAASQQRAWSALTQWERKQNLLQADHWPVRLRALRCRLGRRVATSCEPLVLTEEEAVSQARMEHNRYLAQKLFDGWRYGPQRVDAARINPFLVDWDSLPASQQQREVDAALRQPAYFAEQAICFQRRRRVIGVTGHRLNKLDVNNPKLRQRITAALQHIGDQYPGHDFLVLSPLAEGADRLVAQLAMEVLDASLQVPLPLPYELYLDDFTDAASADEFQQLVGRAEYYYEMPMRFGNLVELAGNNEARNCQYALAGAYVAQRSDHLIAIYDGQPEAGTGGTGQVLRWYEQGGVSDEFHYGPTYFAAPQKTPAVIIPPYPQ